MMVVTHKYEAVGYSYLLGRGVFLQAQNVRIVFLYQIQERVGVGIGLRFPASQTLEAMYVVAYHGDHLRVLLAVWYLGGSANLHEESHEAPAHRYGCGAPDEMPLAHHQPQHYHCSVGYQ